ncbi:MAG: hypothetical protein Q9218_000511 [Villophora microphyllina]
MRLRKHTTASTIHPSVVLFFLPCLACAFSLDCSDIRDNKQSFDISALGNPISVMTSEDHFPTPTMTNTTFTIDICKPLKKAKGIPKEEDCPNGSRVCGIQRLINTFENRTSFAAAIPIAGQYTLHGGTELDPEITRLKTSSSPSDREKEGFRLSLQGPKFPEKNGRKHKAVIEFLCLDKAEERALRTREEKAGAMDEDDDGEEDHSATDEVSDDGHGGTLKYLDFDVVGDDKVLSLEWRTKYACESAKGESPTKSPRHWGFFTWFIIMYVPSHLPDPNGEQALTVVRS